MPSEDRMPRVKPRNRALLPILSTLVLMACAGGDGPADGSKGKTGAYALLELEVALRPHRTLAAIHDGKAELACVFTGRRERLPAASVVLVTARHPADEVYQALVQQPDALAEAGIKSLRRIGDCFAPGTIAAAVYSGHLAARGLDQKGYHDFQREVVALNPG